MVDDTAPEVTGASGQVNPARTALREAAAPDVSGVNPLAGGKRGRGRPPGKAKKKKGLVAVSASTTKAPKDPVQDALEGTSAALQDGVRELLDLGRDTMGGPPEVWEHPPAPKLKKWGDTVAPVILPHVAEHADKYIVVAAVLATVTLFLPRVRTYAKHRESERLNAPPDGQQIVVPSTSTVTPTMPRGATGE